VCFGVGYHPDEILKRAVEEACIKLEKGETLFPVKSACWVTFDSASVRPGYQQDPITLYKRES
jgi:hypothetical protein